MKPVVLVLVALSLVLSASCASECDPASLGLGEAEARVDGEEWSVGGATWMEAGSSVQLTIPTSGGWGITLVAQTTLAGDSLSEALDAGTFPIEISLGSEGGGFATIYPEEGLSYSSRTGSGGELVIHEVDEALEACFSFEALSTGGEAIDVSGGRVRASGS